MIIYKIVVRVGDPEASRRLISVKQRPASFSHNDAVVMDQVLLFNSIFNEDYVTLDVVADVVDQAHVMGTVKSERTVETLVRTESFAV